MVLHPLNLGADGSISCGTCANIPESFRKWHSETPDDFVFTLKGPRFATNRRVLAEAGDSIANSSTAASPG